MAGVGAAAVCLMALLHKQLVYSMFDQETAKASGIRAGWWDLLFFLILGVIISLAIRLVGTLLVFAFLVVPAVTGLLLSQKMGKITAIAVGAASIATVGGLYASVKLDLPSGPAIVACSFMLLAIAWVVTRFR
jgi:ABC-type Mn2+/Zn2+ transport system permease subunit